MSLMYKQTDNSCTIRYFYRLYVLSAYSKQKISKGIRFEKLPKVHTLQNGEIYERKNNIPNRRTCKLFDIGVDSIRYYEEVGILRPKRDPINNYRLYTIEDVRKLTMIRELLGLNLTTEQIRDFDANRNIHNTISLLEQELHMVNESLLKLYETKNSTQARLENFTRAMSAKHFDTIQLLELDKRACVMINDGNLPDDYVDFYLTKYMRSRQKKIDTIGACDCYTLDLAGSNPDSKYYRTKNLFFYSDLITYDSNFYLPAGKYLSALYKGPLTQTKKFVPMLADYAKKHHLKTIDDPIEFCHIDDYETALEEEYITEIQWQVE